MAHQIVNNCKESADSIPGEGISDSVIRPTVLAAAGELQGNGVPMSGAASVSHPWVHVALATGLLLPLSGAAQLPSGGQKTSSSFSVSVTVQPQFRILESTPVSGGHEYLVWTNMRSIQLNGNEYRFDRVGEATVVVPGELIEHPMPAQARQQ
jgi:hypothetical protein